MDFASSGRTRSFVSLNPCARARHRRCDDAVRRGQRHRAARVLFPHPEQLVSVGLIDPKASDQNNNFGNGIIPAAQDYEDIKAAQKSFAMMAGYLNGSTINVTYENKPQRYTGA